MGNVRHTTSSEGHKSTSPRVNQHADGRAGEDGHRNAVCHARAERFVTELTDSPVDTIWWDVEHPLRGYVRIFGLELVVIAPRETTRTPFVLTALDWDEVHRAPQDERLHLLRRCAIVDHDALGALLASSSPEPSAA